MSKPNICQRQPLVQKVEPGTYYWCACGQSKTQPFCDGSHKGTEFTPVKFEVKKPDTIAWCMCKHTENPPKCDGTHGVLMD